MIFPSALTAHYSSVKKASKKRITEFSRDMASVRNKESSKYSLNQSKVKYFQQVSDMKSNPNLASLIDVIERLLIYHSSVQQKSFTWDQDKNLRWEQFLQDLMRDLTVVIPRVDGDCYKFPKMHLLKHVTESITEYGAPLNFDCSSGEHALQSVAKNPAKTANKTGTLEEFYEGLAARISILESTKKVVDAFPQGTYLSVYSSMLQKAAASSDRITFDQTEEPDCSAEDDCEDEGGDCNKKPSWAITYRVIFLMNEHGQFVNCCGQNLYTLQEVSFISNQGEALPKLCKIELKRDVVRWMKDACNNTDFTEKYLPIFTDEDIIHGLEFRIAGYYDAKLSDVPTGRNRIRCHPNFYNRGPRYDFVLQSHTPGNQRPHLLDNGMIAGDREETISRLLVLYRNNLDGSLRAILNPCGFKPVSVSKLTSAYTLETTKKTSIDGTLFYYDGTQPKNAAMRKINRDMQITETTFQPSCLGTQLYKLSQPVRCYVQDGNLTTDYADKNDCNTQVLYCTDMRQHWITYLK